MKNALQSITVKSIYANNGLTAKIKLYAGGSVSKRQVQRACNKLCLAGNDYIKLDASCNQKPVSIYDAYGNFCGELT